MAKNADLVQRAVAAVVDLIILLVVYAVLGALFMGPMLLTQMAMMWSPMQAAAMQALGMVVGMLSILVAFVYFVYFEGTSGQTLGKKAMDIKVVREDGKKVTYREAIIRNVIRIVDWLPFAYIIGLIVFASGDKKQRLGDLAAQTLVVKA